MAIEISTMDLRERMGEFLDRVRLRREVFVVARKGKPVAALVSIERLQQFEEASRARLLEMFNALTATPGMTDDEAMRLADEAKHATRPKRKPRR